jgi:hypothetical protein
MKPDRVFLPYTKNLCETVTLRAHLRNAQIMKTPKLLRSGAAFILGVLLSLQVWATSTSVQTVMAPTVINMVNNTQVVFTPLTVITSRAGETQEAVIWRTAKLLQTFTQKTRMEACGDIHANAKNQLRIVVGTLYAHIGCMMTLPIPQGYHDTGLTIHSHPDHKSFLVNAADVATSSLFTPRRPKPKGLQVFFNMFRMSKDLYVGGHASVSEKNAGFSPTDLRQKQSYLVTDGHLLYQENGLVTDKGMLEK